MRTEGTHTKTGTRSHRQDHTFPGKKKDLAVRGEQERHKQKQIDANTLKSASTDVVISREKKRNDLFLRLYSTGEVQVSLSKKNIFRRLRLRLEKI